jgi:hypothetical protein
MRRERILSVVATVALILGISASIGLASNAVGRSSTPLASVQSATPSESYVTHVYSDLLGRAPDSGGLGYWSDLLGSGVPRPAVAWALVTSDEYRGDVIAEMYQQYLQRSVDAGGQAYWVAQVRGGLSFEQFESLLLGSDEYYVNPNKGAANPAAFVASMYHDMLGRTVDPAGQQYFVGLLAAGTPRSQVVAAVVYSYEHLATTVNGYYQHFLHRSADSAGQAYWTNQLAAGGRDELILGLIIGSDEYFAQASPPPPPTTTTTTTTGPKTLPDLVVTAVSATPGAPQPGQSTNFTATVRNQGAGPAPAGVPIGVAFAVDGSQATWATFQTGGLASGASIALSTTGTPNGGPWTATAGNHMLDAYVDQNPPGAPAVNRIAESNENNNKLSAPLNIAAACGATVTANLVLTSDLICSQDALNVGADGITIDLGGHTLLGVTSGANIGVDGGDGQYPLLHPAHSFTLKNGTIAGFATGASAVEPGANPGYGTHHITVDHVHFVAGAGVSIIGFSGNTVTHSTFEGRQGDQFPTGIGTGYKGGAATDTFAFNTFTNLSTGVSLGRAGGAKIDQNSFSIVNTAVSLFHASDVTITGNHIDNGGRLPTDSSSGIAASDATDNVTITGNTIEGLQVGVRLLGGGFGIFDITVSGNTIESNGASGIAVIGDNQDRITIRNNNVDVNGFTPGNATNQPLGSVPLDDGISVDVTSGSVVLAGNVAGGNADHGIEATGATDGGGNKATGNHGSPQCVGVICS